MIRRQGNDPSVAVVRVHSRIKEKGRLIENIQAKHYQKIKINMYVHIAQRNVRIKCPHLYSPVIFSNIPRLPPTNPNQLEP